ncbi:MAG: chemotaxis response regulator protein-glutamate methylesterase [Gammaproteobacteria bacterium RIFCSPLOWO2_12_47_11]|nr:MAG: chemotaxis response regulator protein-glutamate methylesterase [Gammaproteobacteria bacterium RIFCSPLOWO2_12_47_11]
MSASKINVLISEDSPTSRDLLGHILNTDPDIRIIGMVSNGEEAVAAVAKRKPDVIMMDVHMPGMDGFEATRRIMQVQPVPIVIVSETLDDQVAATFLAIEAGALAFVRHPPGPGHPDHAAAVAELLQIVKLMSEVKVVRRWNRREHLKPVPEAGVTITGTTHPDVRLIAIGASTGGPVVLQHILSVLAPSLNVPLLIVQHIAPGFVQGLTEWLGQSCGLPAHVATNRELALPGHIYIAPEGFHMGIDSNGRIKLSDGAPEHGIRPSVSWLFRSVAEALGPNAAGVLLTGMGKDGADGLKLMKDKGAVTIAHDETSSIVHGMPGVAISLDAATHVLPPENIAQLLERLLKNK